MAFIVLSEKDQEWDRLPLREAITIGRSPECNVPVRDFLLSRRHCRIEPHGRRWVLIDLDSKNGTRVGNEPVTRHVLEDGEIVRIGRNRICFREGPFVPAPADDQARPNARPADPLEAMAATVAGIALSDMDEDSRVSGFPIPKPLPAEPKAYRQEGVGTLVSQMASGVWDTRMVYEGPTRRAARPLPKPGVGIWETPAEAGSGLREAISRAVMKPMSMPALQPAPRVVRRAQTPTGPRPGRWLVVAYIGLAYAVFLGSVLTIAWAAL